MIGVFGISYRSAGAEIRERYSFRKEEIPFFLDKLVRLFRNGRFVVLSTCNRTEIYFFIPDINLPGSEKAIKRAWEDFKEIRHGFHPLYLKKDTEAVRHLFSVASGLDSRLIGESQIIDQVKDAYGISVKEKSAGPILNRLFHKSFEASKSVRTRTRLSDGDVGIGDIISRMIRERTDPVVLVIGTGQIANHVLGRVHRKSCGRLVVAGRTPENVDLTARKYDAEPLSTNSIESVLPECDVVISAVSVSEPVITGKMLSSESFINRGQGDREESVLFIDLGMPANIERGISQSHQLILMHYEALEEQIRSTLDRRTLEVHKANLLIDENTEDYFSWLRSKELDPALTTVRQTLDSINLSGIEAFCNKKEAGKKSQEVEEYSRFITSEIMNMISRNIKSLTRNGADIEATDYLTKLFDTKSA